MVSDNGTMRYSKHHFKVFVLGILLAGGFALGEPEDASAAAPVHASTHSHQLSRGCDEVWGDDGCDTHSGR